MLTHKNETSGVVSHVFDAGADKSYREANLDVIGIPAPIVAIPNPTDEELQDAGDARKAARDAASGRPPVMPPVKVGPPATMTPASALALAEQEALTAMERLEAARDAAQAAQAQQDAEAKLAAQAKEAADTKKKEEEDAAAKRDADPAKAGYDELAALVGKAKADLLAANGIGTLDAAKAAPVEQLKSIDGIADGTVDKIKGVG